MNKESESDRFGRLAKEDPELVYKAIETSDEPWWGFEILSQLRMNEYRDEERIRKLVQMRSQHMIESLRTSSTPYEITWSLARYTWFLEQDDAVGAIAIAIENSIVPWQIINDIRHNRDLMKNQRILDAFTHVIRTNPRVSQFVNCLRDYPNYLIESKTQDAIIDAIKNNDEIWWLVSEVLSIRVLAEQQAIKDAIQSRAEEIIEAFRTHPKNWQIVPLYMHFDDFVEDPRVIDAIGEGIQNTDNAYAFLYKILPSYALTKKEIIHEAIALRIERAPEEELWQLIGPLKLRRILVESKSIRSTIDKE